MNLQSIVLLLAVVAVAAWLLLRHRRRSRNDCAHCQARDCALRDMIAHRPPCNRRK